MYFTALQHSETVQLCMATWRPQCADLACLCVQGMCFVGQYSPEASLDVHVVVQAIWRPH